MPPKDKMVYTCNQCGFESRKWVGKCPGCDEWNTMVEELAAPAAVLKAKSILQVSDAAMPLPLSEVVREDFARSSTGIGELNRVLGGGIVAGSLVLIGGDPGIGKSTLLLQTADHIAAAGETVLYVTGEESTRQVALRASRLGAASTKLLIHAETDLSRILFMIEKLSPSLVIIDSIQTMFVPEVSSAPGSVAQVRESAARLMQVAKGRGCSIFLVGHVTKAGSLAGPRVLEHIVDTVLYFEGEQHQAYRVLRAVKNRFGSTNEIGIFEMREEGMAEVANPSELFLLSRERDVAGSTVVASMEGSRPVLVEIQALVCPTAFGMPRRQAAGMDYNRMVLLLAVLEKRAGMRLSDQDVYINVAGGLRLIEPATDLSMVMATASSLRGKPVPMDTVAIGEVGLTGEVRPVSHVQARLMEAARTGFRRCVLPQRNLKGLAAPKELKLIPVSTVAEALAFFTSGHDE